MNDKLSGMLGLAMRAGRVTVGTQQVCLAMPTGRVRLVLVSEGASDNTKKKVLTKSDFYGISAITVDIDTAELGRLLGKTHTPACVAITDENFAKQIKLLAERTDG